MKKGILLVNSYVKSEKFSQLYRLLELAAPACDVSLSLRGNGEVCLPVPGAWAERPDFVLFWDKDVALARAMEGQGIPLFNCSRAIEACDDKRRTQDILARAGIPMPPAVSAPLTFDAAGYDDLSFIDRAGETLGWPMVIKEAFGSFGMQVHLARDREEAEGIVRGMGNRPFLMQKFIAAAAGRDVRVNVVGGRVAACMARESQNGDFRSNATLGGRVAACDPPEEVKALAVRGAEALGLDFAGVDVLTDGEGRPLICEVNSNPHFATTLACTGVDMAPLILRHIRERLQ